MATRAEHLLAVEDVIVAEARLDGVRCTLFTFMLPSYSVPFTRCGVRLLHACASTHTHTHSHARTNTHMRFHNNAMLPSSHLLNGVGIAATSPGLSFDWWRILCACVCVDATVYVCDSEPPPPRKRLDNGSV